MAKVLKTADISPQANLNFMDGVNAFVFEPGIGKKRVEILCKQLLRYGGKKSAKFTKDVTHIIVSKNTKIAKLCKSLGVDKIKDSIIVLDADWLSACYMEGRKCNVVSYLLQMKTDTEQQEQQEQHEQHEQLDIKKLEGDSKSVCWFLFDFLPYWYDIILFVCSLCYPLCHLALVQSH